MLSKYLCLQSLHFQDQLSVSWEGYISLTSWYQNAIILRCSELWPLWSFSGSIGSPGNKSTQVACCFCCQCSRWVSCLRCCNQICFCASWFRKCQVHRWLHCLLWCAQLESCCCWSWRRVPVMVISQCYCSSWWWNHNGWATFGHGCCKQWWMCWCVDKCSCCYDSRYNDDRCCCCCRGLPPVRSLKLQRKMRLQLIPGLTVNACTKNQMTYCTPRGCYPRIFISLNSWY